MFALSLRHADHVREYSIRQIGSSGWEVRLEEDRTVQRLTRYTDWHRVERAQAMFEIEVTQLEERGWTVLKDDLSR
jgi:hypothetical protein